MYTHLRTEMSHQNDTISEYHIAIDGLNTNAVNNDNNRAITTTNGATTTTTAATSFITTTGISNTKTNTINDYNINNDNADRSDASNDCDKPDYLNIDCDRNLNIRCVGMDFEVNKFYMFSISFLLFLSV